MTKPLRKAFIASSWEYQPTPAAGSMLVEKSISKMPMMRCICGYCMLRGASEESQADLEQTLHIADIFLVDHEQDDMVIGFDHGRVVGNQHLVVADDGADSGTRRQINLTDRLADHLGRACVAVGNCLDGFCRAAAQRVDVDDVTPAHVGQQGA